MGDRRELWNSSSKSMVYTVMIMIIEMAMISQRVFYFFLDFQSFAFPISLFSLSLIVNWFIFMDGVWNFLEYCLWGMEFIQAKLRGSEIFDSFFQFSSTPSQPYFMTAP